MKSLLKKLGLASVFCHYKYRLTAEKKIEEILLKFGKDLELELKKEVSKTIKLSGSYSPKREVLEIDLYVHKEETLKYISEKKK